MPAVARLLTSRAYWLALALFSGSMLAVALYYQYALGEEPCQACIQVRLWVVGLLVLGLLMACLPAKASVFAAANLLAAVFAVGLAERSWFLYQLENGKGDGSCEFQLGMPDWFAVDRWFPSLFEVRNLCSFTPDMLFGLSMAEGLLLAAAGLIVGIVCSMVATFSPQAFPPAGVSDQPKDA